MAKQYEREQWKQEQWRDGRNAHLDGISVACLCSHVQRGHSLPVPEVQVCAAADEGQHDGPRTREVGSDRHRRF